MAALLDAPELETLADLQHHLGDIPAWRIRLKPAPGTATEADVIAIHAREKRLYELIDGVLVEKGMGFRESLLAASLIVFLDRFVRPRKLGVITGEAGMLKLRIGLVRIPDVAFISWDSLPGRKVPKEPIPLLAPDLAIEVLSASNTIEEIKRKCREYFKAGTSLMWIVDPKARTVTIHTSPRKGKVLTESQTLDGGSVLPGFTLSLRELFAELDQVGEE
jgi:Uma2 family endonuclease